MMYLHIKNGNIFGFFETGGSLNIIDDPAKLFMSNEYDPQTDHIHQIGNEVKVKIVVETLPTKRET